MSDVRVLSVEQEKPIGDKVTLRWPAGMLIIAYCRPDKRLSLVP